MGKSSVYTIRLEFLWLNVRISQLKVCWVLNVKHFIKMSNLDIQNSLMLSFIKEELKEKAKIEDEKKDEEKEDPKGIPEFWLTVFKNVDLLSDMVQVILFIKHKFTSMSKLVKCK